VLASLTTDRLLLRPFEERDLAAFAALNIHPDVVAMLGSSPSRGDSDAMVVRFTEELAREGWGIWAIEVVGGAPFVGFCGLHALPPHVPASPAVEVGWRLDPEHWGHGYATEGALAALAHGFGPCGLDEIVSITAVINVRSQAVMQRIGMTRDVDGDFEHQSLPVGHELRPHVLYRIRA
jgi:RimJ/RimL family protein N-acetyltransferase